MMLEIHENLCGDIGQPGLLGLFGGNRQHVGRNIRRDDPSTRSDAPSRQDGLIPRSCGDIKHSSMSVTVHRPYTNVVTIWPFISSSRQRNRAPFTILRSPCLPAADRSVGVA
jgi:hypothetical protein